MQEKGNGLGWPSLIQLAQAFLVLQNELQYKQACTLKFIVCRWIDRIFFLWRFIGRREAYRDCCALRNVSFLKCYYNYASFLLIFCCCSSAELILAFAMILNYCAIVLRRYLFSVSEMRIFACILVSQIGSI